MATNCEDSRCAQTIGAGHGLFGYTSPPLYPLMSREVYRWMQSLDLSYALRNPRRDCANGFLVAEVLSRYFPRDISMHSYRNGTSSATRNDNWEQLQRACRKHGFAVPKDLVQGCKAGEFGAAAAVLELLYEHFTQRQIRRPIELPADTTPAAPALSQPQSTSNDLLQFPGAAGANLVSKASKPAAEIKFGEVKQRSLDDAMALRQKLAAGA